MTHLEKVEILESNKLKRKKSIPGHKKNLKYNKNIQ